MERDISDVTTRKFIILRVKWKKKKKRDINVYNI
jgi:hypothetical protein